MQQDPQTRTMVLLFSTEGNALSMDRVKEAYNTTKTQYSSGFVFLNTNLSLSPNKQSFPGQEIILKEYVEKMSWHLYYPHHHHPCLSGGCVFIVKIFRT